MIAHIDARPAIPPMPRLSLVLLAAAVVDFALLVWMRSVAGNYFELSAPQVLADGLEAMPFVLAASLAAGWNRWESGKGLLMAAAAAFATAAVVSTGSQLALAVALSGVGLPSLTTLNAITGLSLLATLGTIGAWLLAAAGLSRGAALPSPGGWRSWASRLGTAVALLVAFVATVTAARVWYEIASVESSTTVLAPFSSVIWELQTVPLAVLGAVAIRRLTNRYLLPELLIGSGALAASLTWWGWSLTLFLASLPQPPVNGVAIGAVANAIQVAAIATVALGFFSARISIPGES